jgi:cytochrome c oxidase subunit 2
MQSLRRRIAATLLGVGTGLITIHGAWAQEPLPWQMGLQRGFSPVKRDIIALNDLVLAIIVVITALVAGLLVYVMWRFSAKRHPVPNPVTHNTPLEIAWTVIPILILVLMAIPSFRLVYYENRAQHPDMTIKVTGHQWFWEYAYPDQGNIDFASNIIPDDEIKPPQIRLLSVNHPLVLPVGKSIRILETSGDVIHSFFIPSLGVQRYAIPGRTIETWVRIDKPGTYYGECNQICGMNHSRMPIEVQAVTPAAFAKWVTVAKKEFSADASDGKSSTQLASAAQPQR